MLETDLQKDSLVEVKAALFNYIIFLLLMVRFALNAIQIFVVALGAMQRNYIT